MTLIEAAEDSFGKANSYFVLTWVVTALVLITAFVDYRSYTREVAVNDVFIELFADLENVAASVAKKLRAAIYLAPGYSSEKEGIETLRRLRSEVLARVVWMEDNYGQKIPDLTIEDRLVIQPALNFMKAMLLLNDPTGFDSVSVENEPALPLAEHEAGSYLTADKIEYLRMEDATRYLWLSSLDLQGWNAVLKTHQAALSAERLKDDIVADFSSIIEGSSTPERRSDRQEASDLWVKWLKSALASTTNGVGGRVEARRRASMTLAQSSTFLDQALKKKAELDLLAGGQSTTVEIPLVSIPLQLRDAIIVAPWILAFCSLSIMIYTRRAIRYSPDQPKAGEVVGNAPSFYAAYGVSSLAGILIAMLLLWLPSTLMAVLLPVLQPISTTALDVTTAVFFGGILVSIIFSFFTVSQVSQVLRLVDLGVIVKVVKD